MTEKITISLPRELVSVLDAMVRAWKTTRSGAIRKLLERSQREQLEAIMAEGYQEWAEKNRADAELHFAAQAEVVLGGSEEG